jgi:DNA-binding IclR family transcriptional regulator
MRDDGAGAGRAPIPRAPQRIMQLLQILASAGDGLMLSKLSRQLATPKSSLLNLLRALERDGYVEHADGLYRLGRASLRLAATITGGDPLLRAVRHLLRRLARESDETAMLGILAQDGLHAMCVESFESRNALGFAIPIGRPTPLYCSTMGRVLLAFGDPAEAAAYLESVPLKAYTTTSRKELEQELVRIRRAGFAEAHGQMTEGVAGIGAPVFDRLGRVEAVVITGVPIDRLAARREALVALVRQTGMEMSELRGYRGAYPPGTAGEAVREASI